MTMDPVEAGFRQPAEWAPHLACWVAWPSSAELWPDLSEAQTSFIKMCTAIARPARQTPGERLEVLVQNAGALAVAEGALAGLRARFHVVPFGDIWLRDTAPVFLEDGRGHVASLRFRFNGWGEKYLYEGDGEVAARVQALSGARDFSCPLVCEGGAVESDGEGLCLTTRAVVLNDNRNPGRSESQASSLLARALGADRVLFVSGGLLNDHTDGHIDNIARFIAPRRVLCMHPQDREDPNHDALRRIAEELESHGLDVVSIPSPGLVTGRDGQPLPASYLNFYIANHSVVVPVFGSPRDEVALARIESFFPGRAVIGVPAKVFLEEGGTVHCITQQQPAGLVVR